MIMRKDEKGFFCLVPESSITPENSKAEYIVVEDGMTKYLAELAKSGNVDIAPLENPPPETWDESDTDWESSDDSWVSSRC
jgi:hypothetical protein